MKFALEIIVAIFAVISGFCWIKAARIAIRPLGGVIGPAPRMFVERANNQAWWNSKQGGMVRCGCSVRPSRCLAEN